MLQKSPLRIHYYSYQHRSEIVTEEFIHALFLCPPCSRVLFNDQVATSIVARVNSFATGSALLRCRHQHHAAPKVQQALKASKLGDDALSLVMLPLNGPGTPTVFNADVSVNPASTMKLITTYAALEMLGPTHQWKTEFFTDGTLSNGVLRGNLYLKGGGDPKLNMEKLWLLMRDLRANGVQQVTGDLVLDRSHFVQPQLPEFNDDGNDDNKPFLVKPDALMVNLKALRFVTRNDDGRILVRSSRRLRPFASTTR